MLLQNRNRDCVVLYKGDAFTVMLDEDLRAQGWQGGQAVMWKDSVRDEFLVGRSDGRYGGFLLWGSSESSDQLVATLEQQPAYGYATYCMGGWLIMTRTFEQYTWSSRNGGGPLIPLTYQVGQRVLFSLRGFWTIEDEWTLSGDSRAPNKFYTGLIAQAPTSNDNGTPYLTIWTSL